MEVNGAFHSVEESRVIKNYKLASILLTSTLASIELREKSTRLSPTVQIHSTLQPMLSDAEVTKWRPGSRLPSLIFWRHTLTLAL